MAINTTPNLHLPQWTPNEKPSYLVDFNAAFKNIDDGFAGITTEADSANQTALGAMAEASSAMSQAQAAMQTANQAQTGLNNHIASLEPAFISLPVTELSSEFGTTVHLIYNGACAHFRVGVTGRSSKAPTGSAINVATFTFPANIKVVNGNLPLSLGSLDMYIEIMAGSTPSVYTVKIYQYRTTEQATYISSATYPVKLTQNARDQEPTILIYT